MPHDPPPWEKSWLEHPAWNRFLIPFAFVAYFVPPSIYFAAALFPGFDENGVMHRIASAFSLPLLGSLVMRGVVNALYPLLNGERFEWTIRESEALLGAIGIAATVQDLTRPAQVTWITPWLFGLMCVGIVATLLYAILCIIRPPQENKTGKGDSDSGQEA